MTEPGIIIGTASADDFPALGQLMVEVYSRLEGFPSREEQPEYYDTLANIGELTNYPDTELIMAKSETCELMGGVVYIGDMQHYGAGGMTTAVKNASGIRLLAVNPAFRGKGIGRALTEACIAKARSQSQSQVILHTTVFMKTAWGLYERMGFERSPDLDFMQKDLPVLGFRLYIQQGL